MKVRIEFAEPEPGEDRESDYDSVEFTTRHAGSIDGWGDAVLDILRPALWSRKAILFSALFQDESAQFPKSSLFVRQNRGNLQLLRDEIDELLLSVQTKNDSSIGD